MNGKSQNEEQILDMLKDTAASLEDNLTKTRQMIAEIEARLAWGNSRQKPISRFGAESAETRSLSK